VLLNDNLNKVPVLTAGKLTQPVRDVLDNAAFYTIIIAQASVQFDRFLFTHELYDPMDAKLMLFRLVNLQIHTFNMYNSDMKVHGKTLFTADPLDFDLKNITFEYDYASYAWALEINCKTPGSTLTGTVVLQNHTVNFIDKKKMRELNGYISYNGPANVTVVDCFFKSENSLETD
jgi:hypothetical protein